MGEYSEDVKIAMREELARREIGYAILEEERRARIRAIVTKNVTPFYDTAFAVARKKPMRTSSGLVHWHEAMRRLYEK